MKIDFKELMSSKTNEQLQDYLNNGEKYIPEAIDTAIKELQKRGKIFSTQEMIAFEELLE